MTRGESGQHYVCQAQGVAPSPCRSIAYTPTHRVPYDIFRVGLEAVDTTVSTVSRRRRARDNNVKSRPGRIHRPPEVAEHQLRGRWHQRSLFISFHFSESSRISGMFLFKVFVGKAEVKRAHATTQIFSPRHRAPFLSPDLTLSSAGGFM